MISEGGTEYGHKVTIARSRNIYGPYLGNPSNPILTHINQNAQNNPIQGVGHADMVQAQDGSWWMVCLGFRPQSGQHHLLGRETFLAPVKWDTNAWPVVNGDGTIDLNMNVATLPQVPVKKNGIRTYFGHGKVGYEWTFMRNPNMENYTFSDDGTVKMKNLNVSIDSEKSSPSFLCRKQEHINFRATTKVSLNNGIINDEGGLTVFMTNGSHYDIFLKQNDAKGGQRVVLRYCLGSLRHIERELPISSTKILIRVEGTNDMYSFSYSNDGKNFIKLGEMNTRYLSTETAGSFTGIVLAMYATSESDNSKGTTTFDYFDYEPLN
jgi:Beta-xylosidase